MQAQQQRKMAQKSATQTPAASLPASSAPSEDGTTTQNGSTLETLSIQVVPDTDVDSDIDMPSRQPSVATASHDSDTEVRSSTLHHHHQFISTHFTASVQFKLFNSFYVEN